MFLFCPHSFLYCCSQASESPGGLGASASGMEFPTAMEANIVTIVTTPESYDDLDLSSFTETDVTSARFTNLTDNLGETDITAYNPDNWKASTWNKDHL